MFTGQNNRINSKNTKLLDLPWSSGFFDAIKYHSPLNLDHSPEFNNLTKISRYTNNQSRRDAIES